MSASLTAPAADSSGPRDAVSAGLSYVVRDTVIYNDAGVANNNTWEPYVGVLGNSAFLVGVNTFAEGEPGKQRFAYVVQHVDGRTLVAGDHFFGDDGIAYRGPINASRQDGNPQRIAGDPRPGAVNIITGAEASPHLNDAFRSDGRWDLGFDRLLDGRYGTVQTFSLAPDTLAATPLAKAFDAANGRLTEGVAASNQSSRFGGDLVGLDNGNFVVLVEDRSRVRNPAGNTTVFTIVKPDGTIVRETTVVANTDIWANLAAVQGGFAVRAGGILRFFDNSGDLKGEVDQVTSGVEFDRGRGDATRIAGHIHSPYVFLAGVGSVKDDEGTKVSGVRIAVFDSRTQGFIAHARVDDFEAAFDRVVVASDALDRVTVAYEARPTGYAGKQVVARVLKLDDCAGALEPVTGNFFAFLNHGEAAFITMNPSISMTTREILVAAKGNVNLANAVEQGPDSFAQTSVYTVLTHPEPKDDPTTPATPELPSSLANAGLTQTVADTVIYNDAGVANNNTWEPYVGVLGNSTFLVGVNTFAEGEPGKQRFAFVMQPASGGPNVRGDHFFGDDGTPYRGPINASRQDGNPQRIAGDTRPGAVNIITGAEASPHLTDPFRSDDRWDLGFDRLTDGRYGTVQTFSIHPASLAQTPLSKAFDAANGRATEGVAASNQSTRFGGDLVALDNGNFVVLVEDRSRLRNPAGNATTATIVSPTGAIVKETFVVANGDIWCNLAAYQGGFAVRASGILYFYGNDGTLRGTLDGNASGVAFDRGRGDATRIAGHINRPYVYLAGVAPIITPAGNIDAGVRLAVFDPRTLTAVTSIRVDALSGGFGRVVVTSDALDRVTVAYESKPAGFSQNQVVARVLQFNGCTLRIEPLTENFFAFQNHGEVDFATSNPSVSMTTRQILVAAKGRVNLANNIAAGPDSFAQTSLYTVIAHPNPQDDPTQPVAGGGVVLSKAVVVAGGKFELSWQGGKAPYTLQTRSSITGSWTDVQTGITGNAVSIQAGGKQAYFQVISQ